MSHYIPEKSVFITFRERNVEYEEGIGLARTNHDYFSCTESLKLKNEIGGENYTKLFNTVKPLHLSNQDGEPLHAVENGFYYIQCIKKTEKRFPSDDYNLNTISEHFRINENDAGWLIEKVDTKEDLIKFVDSQKTRWKEEAGNALNLITEINNNLTNKQNQTVKTKNKSRRP